MNERKFTLVELLLSLVLVVIIGLLIIPSVNKIFMITRSKAYEEMVNNFYSKTYDDYEKNYKNDTSDCVVYDISKDLGFDNIGTFAGYTIVKDNKVYMSIYNRFLILRNVPFTNKDDIIPYSKKYNNETFRLNDLVNELGCKDYTSVNKSS